MRPDTDTDHTAEAERLLRTAAQYPEDAEQLLLHAAAHLELAGDRPRATTLYDRLLAPKAPDSAPAPAPAPENPTLIRALKAANLYEYGHEAEAQAIIEGVRTAAPGDPAPWIIAAESLEAHDELEQANTLLTEAAARLLPESEPATQLPHDTKALLITRHRIRRLLALDHDEWDTQADETHTSRGSAIPLDELHDPKRTWSLGSDDPTELRAEITRLQAELGSYREALSRPFPVAILHWPAQEYAELLTAYPTLTTEYPPSHADHLSSIETSLRELSASGTANLGIVTATVPSYEAFAASESTTPEDPNLLPQYATVLAARGRAAEWPPRGDCWCGAGVAYGDCHGRPPGPN